ncbi:probable pectate lyase 12 isoform X2 [Pistacia vera]|uniref:probable pectate lyase 12 isoform X2 n=1 Tax=Pistacia vera TaxID=55513 RepID=UPI0012634EB8|nr:probable pectate lyase 12 isoform X2 [Pistacia vera]
MFRSTCIVLISLLSSFFPLGRAMLNLTFPTPHPNPEEVVQELHRRVNASMSRRQMLQISEKEESSCFKGNPVDDCWKCDPDWANNRQRLADCAIGFGQYAMGGKNGEYYIVTDSSDDDAVTPKPGTLRYAVIQTQPLWIVFPGEANVRSSPTHFGWRTESDGDGISIFGSKDIWIDHCSLSHCKDGLIDAVMGSTGITISNNYFSHHNEVMLLGHSDDYSPDTGMQVTIAFNHFGEKLVQRMPRCRRGYIHVVNNDYTKWEMYAIGGSGSPTINSQGNRYSAPLNPNAKEVTKRVDTGEGQWKGWNWRSEGDIMVNGAFFVASGAGVEVKYEKAFSVEPKSADLIVQLTWHAGVLGVGGRDNNLGMWSRGPGDETGFGAGSSKQPMPSSTSALIALSCFLFLYSSSITFML